MFKTRLKKDFQIVSIGFCTTCKLNQDSRRRIGHWRRKSAKKRPKGWMISHFFSFSLFFPFSIVVVFRFNFQMARHLMKCPRYRLKCLFCCRMTKKESERAKDERRSEQLLTDQRIQNFRSADHRRVLATRMFRKQMPTHFRLMLTRLCSDDHSELSVQSEKEVFRNKTSG